MLSWMTNATMPSLSKCLPAVVPETPLRHRNARKGRSCALMPIKSEALTEILGLTYHLVMLLGQKNSWMP